MPPLERGTVERFEDAREIGFRHAGAVVAHADQRVIGLIGVAGQAHADRAAVGGVRERIADHVFERAVQRGM